MAAKTEVKKLNPYSKEIQNSIRISTILIDIAGNRILTKRLEDVILNKYGNYDQDRIDLNAYSSIQDYFDKNRTVYQNKQVYYLDQIKTIYPNGKTVSSVQKFDITLCISVLRNLLRPPMTSRHAAKQLNPWCREPDFNDTSLVANLVRLKIIRDLNYAHINKLGVNDQEMIRLSQFDQKNYPKSFSLLAKLEYAIYGLCVGKKEIDSVSEDMNTYCRAPLEERTDKNSIETTVDRYKELITNIFMKDAERNEILLEEIKKSNEGNEKIVKLIDETRKLDKTNFDKVKVSQKNIIKLCNNKFESIIVGIYDVHIELKKVNDAIKKLDSSIATKHDVIVDKASEIQKDVKNTKLVASEIREEQANQQAALDVLVNNQLELTVNIPNCLTINIEDFKGYFDEENLSSFKILILDYEGFNFENIDRQKFIQAIVFSKWNVIIDLNSNRNGPNSIDNEICSMYQDHLKIGHIKRKINEPISNSDKYCIMNGSMLCYFIIDDSITDYAEDLRMFFEKGILTQKSFMCTNFFLKSSYVIEYLEQIEELNKAIKGVLYKSNKKETLDLIYFKLNDLNNLKFSNDIRKLFGKSYRNVEKKFLSLTSGQFISAMVPQILDENKKFYLPGFNGSQMEWTGVYNNYSGFIEVYHDKIGEMEINDENQQRKYIDEKVTNFIIGNEIDPETIYINDEMTPIRHQTYVNIKLMDQLKDKILQKSKKKEFFKNNELVRNIFHAPFSGGTTIGRVVLYKLRRELPCMRLLYYDQDNKLIEALKEISMQTELPLVILIDSDSILGSNEFFTSNKVEDFSRRVGIVEFIRHFVIYVQRSVDENSIPQITKEEEEAYVRLYENYLVKTSLKENEDFELYYKNLATIRLLCLKSDHQKQAIEKIAREYIEMLDNDKELGKEQISFMILVYFFDIYSSDHYFNTDLLAFILNIENQSRLNQLFQCGGKTNIIIFHLLKYKRNCGFKMLNNTLFKRMIQIIAEREKKDKLVLFFDEFKAIIFRVLLENNSCLKEPLIMTTRVLITQMKFLKKNKKNNENSDSEDDSENSSEDENLTHVDTKLKYSNGVSKTETENDDDKKQDELKFPELILECLKNENFGMKKTENILSELFELFKKYDDPVFPFIGSVHARFVFHANGSYTEKERALKIIQKAFNIKDSIKTSPIEENIRKAELLGAYADLFRHFTFSTIKVEKKEKSKNFQKAYQLAEESLYAYEKANEEAKENNPLLLIGECKTRKGLLFHFYNDVCEKSRALFSESMENDKTPKIIKESKEIIPLKLEKLEKIRSTEFTYSLQNLYHQCRIQLLELFYDINIRSFENISSVNKSEILNLYRIIRQTNQNYKKWSDISEDHLVMMIKRYGHQYKEKKTQLKTKDYFFSSFFKDLILAHIHLANKNPERAKNYTIELVLNIALEWKRTYKNDPDAYFYCGVLYLKIGFDKNDDKYIEKAIEDLKECKVRYKNMDPPAPKKLNSIEFLFGKDPGLSNLIVYNGYKSDKNVDLNRLKKFDGEMENRNGYTFLKYKNLLFVKCLDRNAIDNESKVKEVEKNQRKRYEYHIAISRRNSLMYKYKAK